VSVEHLPKRRKRLRTPIEHHCRVHYFNMPTCRAFFDRGRHFFLEAFPTDDDALSSGRPVATNSATC
jgi:hypothetical protein